MKIGPLVCSTTSKHTQLQTFPIQQCQNHFYIQRGRSLSVHDSFSTYTFGTYKISVQSTLVHKCQFRYKHLQYKSMLVFGRRFVKRFALCYRTVVLSVSVCLSVTLVYCGQMVGWIKMPLSMEVHLGPGDTVLNGDTAPPPERGTALQPSTHFLAHCSGTVAHLSCC